MLGAFGVEAIVVDYGGLGSDPTYASVAARIAARTPGDGWTFVVHSGAGALVPSIVEAAPGAQGAVFVDAILPHPGRSWMQTAPPHLAARLRELASDGMLPPWNTWFGADPLAALLPRGEERAMFVAELPLLPLAWFEQAAPSPTGWEALPCAYLQLSGAYAAEAAEARRRGWPTARLDLSHLAIVTHPDTVAQALLSLVEA